MTEEAAIFSDMEEILKKIHKHVEKIEQANKEIASVLKLLSTLQNKMIKILKDVYIEVKSHTEILKHHTEILKHHTEILKEHSAKLDQHSAKLDEVRKDIKDIKESLRRLIGELESEARDVVSIYINTEYNIKVDIKKLEIRDIVEINLYGHFNDICIIGECKNRIGPSVLLKVLLDAIKLHKHRPDMLKEKIILVVYGLRIIDLAKRFALKYGIGLITPRGFIIKPKIQEVSAIKKHAEDLKREIYSKP
ncbi:MAG: hypothetical protein Q6363_003745 [Candidatus Njordarchaeota archaeon]